VTGQVAGQVTGYLRRIRIPTWDAVPAALRQALVAAGEQGDDAAGEQGRRCALRAVGQRAGNLGIAGAACMAIDLADYETKAHEAVRSFWESRGQAQQRQIAAGRVDAGARGAVTAGRHMDGFIALMIDLVRANGLAGADISQSRALLTLPGYFRPTKW
jgi:hypothetical protein